MTDLQIEKKIRTIAAKKEISIKELAKKTGITEAGLTYIFKNNSMKVEILQKISNVLDVDIREFFGGVGIDIKKLEEKENNDALKSIIFEKTLTELLEIIGATFKYSKKHLSDRDLKLYLRSIDFAIKLIDKIKTNKEFDALIHSKKESFNDFLKDVNYTETPLEDLLKDKSP